MAETIHRVMAGYPDLVEGEPWVQGDHGLFLLNQRPALAVTSEMVGELLAEITHTPRDTVEIVSPVIVVQAAAALRDLLQGLGQV